MKATMMKKPLPRVVSPDEWQAARDKLLAKEKAATRDRDALAAERRRLPMVEIDKDYVFEGLDGKASLLDLLEPRGNIWPERVFPGRQDGLSQLFHQRTRR